VNVAKLGYWTLVLLAFSTLVFFGCQSLVRRMMFFPTHHAQDNGLARWTHDNRHIGFARAVDDPQNVWLLLHGNGGQAADRTYALPAFNERDAVFILEYPGYGQRSGKLSRPSFDAAAQEAYEVLRAEFAGKPVCVAAESLGGGPASVLARLPNPPDKFVFIVPFDDVKSLAREHVSWLPTGLMLAGSWDNVESMAGFRGPVEVFGAERDGIIPVQHARRLAASLPQAKFHRIPGGHNDWSLQPQVRIRNP
jgi:pimeloyl-ACP methyl ester carboxylesterase